MVTTHWNASRPPKLMSLSFFSQCNNWLAGVPHSSAPADQDVGRMCMSGLRRERVLANSFLVCLAYSLRELYNALWGARSALDSCTFLTAWNFLGLTSDQWAGNTTFESLLIRIWTFLLHQVRKRHRCLLLYCRKVLALTNLDLVTFGQ